MVIRAFNFVLLLSPTLVLSQFVPMESNFQETNILSISKKHDETVGCMKWKCATKKLVPTNQCAVYQEDDDTVYVGNCIEGNYCTFNDTSELYECESILQSYSWPMEKCKLSTQCIPRYSAGCVNGICSAGKEYPECSYNYQCSKGEWCQSYSCVPLLEIGQFGCKSDASCVYNAGCMIEDNNDGFYNLCVPYWSIQPGERIRHNSCDDNQSMLCSSGYCAKAGDGNYYCLGELKSLKSPPMRCYSTDGAFNFCPSEVDEITGFYKNETCRCGLNENAYGYCSLHFGDPLYVKYKKQLRKWLNSEAIKNCNTGRRFALSCAQDFWNKDDYATLSYYAGYISNYAALQDADKCVISAIYPQYMEIKKEYFKVNFGSFLVLSSLFFLYG